MNTGPYIDGGPVFPDLAADYNGNIARTGMSIRDHFAGLALAALIGHESKDYNTRGKQGVPILCAYAYEYADAMIKARSA